MWDRSGDRKDNMTTCQKCALFHITYNGHLVDYRYINILILEIDK